MENVKNSFMFYHSWKEQMDLMTDVEVRNFINNLIRYDKGEEIILYTKEEKLCWLGIVTGLDVNNRKWLAKSKNGKLGGAPKGNKNALKENNLNNLKQPNQSNEIKTTHPEVDLKNKEKVGEVVLLESLPVKEENNLNNLKQPKQALIVNSKELLLEPEKIEKEKTGPFIEDQKLEDQKLEDQNTRSEIPTRTNGEEGISGQKIEDRNIICEKTFEKNPVDHNILGHSTGRNFNKFLVDNQFMYSKFLLLNKIDPNESFRIHEDRYNIYMLEQFNK